MGASPNKYLVVCLKQLGDQVLLEPALRKLAHDQGAPVAVVAPRAFAPLFELVESARLVTLTTAPRAEQLITFDHGSKAALRSLFLRAKRKNLFLLRDKHHRRTHDLVYHNVEMRAAGAEYRALYYFENCPGEKTAFTPPRLALPGHSPASNGLDDGRYLVLHPTAAWKRKCWRSEHWAEVATRLQEETGLPIVLTGGKADWEKKHAAEIAAAAGIPEQHNFAGRTTLDEFLRLVARSRAVLAIDSSASHLAQAFGRPCLTLFGPTDPVHWHWPTPASLSLHGPAPAPPGGQPPPLALAPAAVLEAFRSLRD